MENLNFLFAAISGIVTVIALITPPITTLINQSGAQRLKKTELLFTTRTSSYTQFIEDMELYHRHITSENFQKLKKSALSSMLFASEKTSIEINNYLLLASNCLSHSHQGFVDDAQLFMQFSMSSSKVMQLLKNDIISL